MTGIRRERPGRQETPAKWHRTLPYVVYLGILLVYYLSALSLGLHPILGRGLSAAIGIRIAPILMVFYLFGEVAWIGLVRERTVRDTADRIRVDLFSSRVLERLVGIPLYIMGTVYTFDIYATFKQAIPDLTVYAWDARLARLDSFLHLGRDPWQWSHSLLGNHGLQFLDKVYTIWYVVLVGSIPLFATWAPLRIRSRFFLTFSAMMMIAGSFLAILFASGGPAYFADFTGDSARFAPLMETLQGTQAVETQARLWELFSHDVDHLYGGISAMPSMHMAVVTLLGIAAFCWNRWLGLIAIAYATLIFLGSFHLGWHYALDGYVSAAVVGLTWWLTRLAVPGDPTPPATRSASRAPPS
jgi:hypothetical protein